METIKAVISTLGEIEVKGKNNLDMLLGCILTLEQLVATAQAEENSKKGDESNG